MFRKPYLIEWHKYTDAYRFLNSYIEIAFALNSQRRGAQRIATILNRH